MDYWERRRPTPAAPREPSRPPVAPSRRHGARLGEAPTTPDEGDAHRMGHTPANPTDRDVGPALDHTPAEVTGYEALAQALCRHEATVFAVPGFPASELGDAWAAAAGAPPPWSVNERVAFEMAFGVAATGRNAAVICKQVGALALADSLANAAAHSGGGGLLLVIADDAGPEFSTIEVDGRLLGAALRVPVFDVADPASAVAAVYECFRLSSLLRLPVTVRATQHALRMSGSRPPMADTGCAGGAIDRSVVSDLSKRGRHAHFWASVQPMLAEELGRLQPPLPEPEGDIAIVACGYPVALAQGLGRPVIALPCCCPLSPWPWLLEALEPYRLLLVAEDNSPVLERELLQVLAPRGAAGKVRGRLTGHLPPFGALRVEDIGAALGSAGDPVRAWAVETPQPRLARSLFRPGHPLLAAITALREGLPDLMLSVDVGSPNRIRVPDMALALGAPVSTAGGAALAGRPSLAVLGDYGLFHSAWPALLEAAARQAPLVAVILLNREMELTGGQALPVPEQLLSREGFTGMLRASGLGEPVWLCLPQPADALQRRLGELVAERRFRVVVVEEEPRGEAGHS